MSTTDIEPDEVELTVLLSFPRSGSNFLQNVVKSNDPSIQCTSIHGKGRFLRRRALLKSHANGDEMLRGELRGTWNRTAPERARIVLVRDPRDVVISYYDFLQPVFSGEVTPDNLFEQDFDWLRAEYRRRTLGREVARPGEGMTGGLYTLIHAMRDWYAGWEAADGDMPTLRLRFEDLLSAPKESFDAIFAHLGLPLRESYDGRDVLVSQQGTSDRPRGRAQGWRIAPETFHPLIARAEAEFAPQIARFGY